MNQNVSAKRLCLCASILALYAVSFVLPAGYGMRQVGGTPIFGIGGRDEPYTVYGWQMFATSFEALEIGLVFWLANPALWLGTFLLATGKWRAASICGIVGLVLGLSAGALLSAFSSNRSHLTIGAFVWLGSLALLATAAWFRPSSGKSSSASPTDSGA